MLTWFIHLLKTPVMLWLVLIINVLGTIYGYIWYGYQLAETPAIFLIFVPDSPTASLFFCFVLVGFIFKKNFKLFEALAIITLVKYGIWAVVMNILTLMENGYLPIEGYMLIVSHGAMAVQGVLYSPYYRFKLWHLVAAGIWTLHNDVIDYVFKMMPWYGSLMKYLPQIGYFTFWLSIFSIGVAYYFSLRNNRMKLSLD
ncbi:MAG: DUF1405 domain-containing protein [Bacillota bacterium]|jgi:uncharacterized membrane protein YpjA|uniref:DUF1405 domain-containing protein n=1 Tax=Bacillus sp. RO2 TaxID=2723913 RepID=UPI00145D46A3|nr:DUF1405 domain-containing protein [Bacillus sp. RO2]MEA3319049.1 DUF1405 domain-containing protein [Bacillota bacterium]NMH74099.1 DUF1405 domain-containing protein [Bacillus sp. RO2]